MRISNKWAIMIALVLSAGFVSCNKDDEKSEITPEEAADVLNANGNDRSFHYGLLGKVQSFTEKYYGDASYGNNTINKGNSIQENVNEFNEAGFLTKITWSENIPTACKWTTDKYGETIVVVTSRSMKTLETETRQYDQAKPGRITEKTDEIGNYAVTFGGVRLGGYTYHDTCRYWSGTANTSNTQVSSTFTSKKSKTVYSYDDASKTATGITSIFDADKNQYVESKKTVYALDQWGRINFSSYERFPVETKSFSTQYDEKKVVEYDSKGNTTLRISLYWEPYDKIYNVSGYYEYSYIYF